MSRFTGRPRRPIRKVLVACQGGAATRVIQACRELGVDSVAVYVEGDSSAQYVRLADEARALGPSPDSYLNIERLVDVARSTRADAVHPGYGLLAESPALARACASNGLVFVGPSPEAMEAIGAKTSARGLAERSGVPILSEAVDLLRDDAHAMVVASRLGFPVAVRALAGAGGRCEAIVRVADDLKVAVNRVRRDSRVFYGDDSVYLERYIAGRRRVGVDILADMHGNSVSLGQRECPVQRLGHRVVELAPAHIPDELRQKLDAAALSLAASCGFHGTGTFEFLVSGNDYYFLEATRSLQAAQAVTEMVARVDIVRAQLRLAAGEPLWLAAGDVTSSGHALSCRIYAGDQEEGSVAQGKTRPAVRLPTGPGLRVDDAAQCACDTTSGEEGLIAQVAAWGLDEDLSRRRMIRALHEMEVDGLSTSIPWLRRVLSHPRVADGHLPAELVELVEDGEYLDGHIAPPLDGARRRPRPQAHGRAGERRFQVSVDGDAYVVEVTEMLPPAKQVKPASREAAASAVARQDGAIISPMRGTVVELAVSEGETVAAGAVLFIVEAMKMENEVRAIRDGVVTGIMAHQGESVAAGATVMHVITEKQR